MNRKNARNSKVQYKAVIFWSVLVLVTLGFLVGIIVKFSTNIKIASYNKVTHLSGQEIYDQGSGKYLVFVYDSTSTDEDLDKIMFNYFTFVKNNKDNAEVLKIYCMDVSTTENKKCIDTSLTKDVISNTETFPKSGIDANAGSTVLQLLPTTIPVLLVMDANKVSTYSKGTNVISEYLQNIIDLNK